MPKDRFRLINIQFVFNKKKYTKNVIKIYRYSGGFSKMPGPFHRPIKWAIIDSKQERMVMNVD